VLHHQDQNVRNLTSKDARLTFHIMREALVLGHTRI
jgi:hypothetical protein